MSAKSLSPLVINNLGVSGLNTQANPSALSYNWLAEANNIVLDEQGRISSRKGFQQVSENLSAGYTVRTVFEYSDAQGDKSIIVAAHGSSSSEIYVVDQSVTPYSFTAADRTQGSTLTAQTLTKEGSWQFVNFNGKLYGVKNGNVPVMYYEDASTMVWADITEHPNWSAPTGITTFDPNSIMGDFGRLWAGGVTEQNNVLFYSDTLIGEDWLVSGTNVTSTYDKNSTCTAAGNFWDSVNGVCYSGASGAGFIDLATVWGGDRIVAVKGFMGKLVIFGTENIAIYNNPWEVATGSGNFQLDEVIKGVGCKARDSIAQIGDDLIFLSNTGVTSLARVVSAGGKMPIKQFSKNIKDDLSLQILTANMDYCKGVYCLCGGFYILAFPERKLIYYMDFTLVNEDETPRITKFTFDLDKCPTALFSSIDGTLWFGSGYNYGYVGKYQNYYDQILTDGTWEPISDSYTSVFKTVWLDFSEVGSNPSIAKLFKDFLGVIVGGKDMSVDFSWYQDYNVSGDSASFDLLANATGIPYLWGASNSLYGTAKFAPSYNPTEYKIPLSGAGKVIQLEMKAGISGYKASLQSITILAKEGKIR